MTPKQERWYQDVLAAYANGSGDRYNTQSGKLTYCAAALRKTDDEVLADLSGLMRVTAKDADNIRRGIASAARKVGDWTPTQRQPRRKPDDQPFGIPSTVPELIRAGGGEADARDLIARSPIDLSGLRKAPHAQTAAFLSALYGKDDLLFIKRTKIENAVPGENLLPRRDWTHERLAGRDCLYRNPLTGKMSKTTGNVDSFAAKDCIAVHRYALLEFDHLPLRKQAAFWLGFLVSSPLAPRLVSLVWSGKRSIHGLVRVNADNLSAPTWEKYLRDRFASNPEMWYKADSCGFKPLGGTRLAGARRNDNGAVQELLYLAQPVTAAKTRPDAGTPAHATATPRPRTEDTTPCRQPQAMQPQARPMPIPVQTNAAPGAVVDLPLDDEKARFCEICPFNECDDCPWLNE